MPIPSPYHARVGDNHALALFCILLLLQFLPPQHVSYLLLRDQMLGALLDVEEHLLHGQHLLTTI